MDGLDSTGLSIQTIMDFWLIYMPDREIGRRRQTLGSIGQLLRARPSAINQAI
jgi:hypothetical protein